MKKLFTIFFMTCFWPVIIYCQKIKEDQTFLKREILWGDHLPGIMKADSFNKQIQIKLPEGYVLKKAIVDFCGANFSTVEKYNLYSLDLKIIKDPISRCVPGTVVYIEKILVVDKSGKETFLSDAGFVLF